jgi:hypothetical protein
VLKTICEDRNWTVPNPGTMTSLIDTIFKNELIPNELQSIFSALRATLESGGATIRNKMTAHGQGKQKVEVPNWLGSYVLNLSASTICFIIEAHREKR